MIYLIVLAVVAFGVLCVVAAKSEDSQAPFSWKTFLYGGLALASSTAMYFWDLISKLF
jgi:hypothetical protein